MSMSNVSPKFDSVVLLSGGLDSAANLAFLHQDGQQIASLFIDYGQRAAQSERRASQQLSEYYGASWFEIRLPWLGALGGNSLTDLSQELPQLQSTELDHLIKTQASANSVWVPNRNGVLLNIAGSWAEAHKCPEIVVGFNVEEAATFPDNSTDFMEATNRAFAYSTRGEVRVLSRTLSLNKRQIVQRLTALEKPFPKQMVWSCYEDFEKPCNTCESCLRSIRAWKEHAC